MVFNDIKKNQFLANRISIISLIVGNRQDQNQFLGEKTSSSLLRPPSPAHLGLGLSKTPKNFPFHVCIYLVIYCLCARKKGDHTIFKDIKNTHKGTNLTPSPPPRYSNQHIKKKKKANHDQIPVLSPPKKNPICFPEKPLHLSKNTPVIPFIIPFCLPPLFTPEQLSEPPSPS